MTHKGFASIVICLGVLALTLAVSAAQEPVPEVYGAVLDYVDGTLTFEGQMAGAPQGGVYDIQFTLFDARGDGALLAKTISLDGVAVHDGQFIVDLDFGPGALDGPAAFLEISLRPSGSGAAYTTLSPRQELGQSLPAEKRVQAPLGPHPLQDHWGQTATGTGTGLSLTSTSSTGRGVYGHASATSGLNYGVYGLSRSSTGRGVFGNASATSGANYGVRGLSYSTSGHGVYGYASATNGVTYGVRGHSNSTEGRGVYGHATATTGTNYGVFGRSNSTAGRGVLGIAGATTGYAYGVFGRSDSTDGRGVVGIADTTSGYAYGVYGRSDSSDGRGVFGYGSTGGSFGVYGKSEGWTGVYGEGDNDGVMGRSLGTDAFATGVTGVCNFSQWGIGVDGLAGASSGSTYGVRGRSHSTSGTGVYGDASSYEGSTYGVYGETRSDQGHAVHGYAIIGPGYAGYFEGKVHVTGNLSKGAGSFKIDHPLDPQNKYLYHSFVESPDMMNIYNGNVILDDSGEAWVTLPDWFQALNRDYRYQLTCVGGFAPVYINEKIEDNRFQIAGGQPGLEISWMVTGIRHDAYAEAHRIPVEETKPAGEQGTYLHPVEQGVSETLGLDYQRRAEKDLERLDEPIPEAPEAPIPEPVPAREVLDESQP